MTLAEARLRYLDWLARERRAAANTVEAYGRDLGDFLGFLARHLGGEDAVDVAGLGAGLGAGVAVGHQMGGALAGMAGSPG